MRLVPRSEPGWPLTTTQLSRTDSSSACKLGIGTQSGTACVSGSGDGNLGPSREKEVIGRFPAGSASVPDTTFSLGKLQTWRRMRNGWGGVRPRGESGRRAGALAAAETGSVPDVV
eukprot:1884294-Rhodomonas_salina.2